MLATAKLLPSGLNFTSGTQWRESLSNNVEGFVRAKKRNKD
jgi:hypothetical protein